MKIKFEFTEANNTELVKATIEGFIKTLQDYDKGITLTNINLYLSAKTPDGMTVTGFEDGDVWLVKPIDFPPRVPMEKYSNPKIICNSDGEPMVKVYQSESPAQASGEYVKAGGLSYQNRS